MYTTTEKQLYWLGGYPTRWAVDVQKGRISYGFRGNQRARPSWENRVVRRSRARSGARRTRNISPLSAIRRSRARTIRGPHCVCI